MPAPDNTARVQPIWEMAESWKLIIDIFCFWDDDAWDGSMIVNHRDLVFCRSCFITIPSHTAKAWAMLRKQLVAMENWPSAKESGNKNFQAFLVTSLNPVSLQPPRHRRLKFLVLPTIDLAAEILALTRMFLERNPIISSRLHRSKSSPVFPLQSMYTVEPPYQNIPNYSPFSTCCPAFKPLYNNCKLFLL